TAVLGHFTSMVECTSVTGRIHGCAHVAGHFTQVTALRAHWGPWEACRTLESVVCPVQSSPLTAPHSGAKPLPVQRVDHGACPVGRPEHPPAHAGCRLHAPPPSLSKWLPQPAGPATSRLPHAPF